MSNICFLILIGLPGAGKTSFCHILLHKFQQYFNIVHVCYDDFLEISQLQQETSKADAAYKKQRQQILNTIKSIITAIAENKEIPCNIKSKIEISQPEMREKNYVILLDDNHYYRSMRYKLYQICKTNGIGFGQLYFVCDEDHAFSRNDARNLDKRLPVHVIKQMSERFEVPNLTQHWETLTMEIKIENVHMLLDIILDFIYKAFQNVPKKVVENIVYNKQENSSLHKLDILLRKHINESLQTEANKNIKRIKANQLNERRKKILEQLREHLPLDDSQLINFVDLLNDDKTIDI